MAIAAPIWGSLSDRLGYKLMVERAMYGGAILLLLMGFARSAEELTLLRTVQGLVTGTISAANALVASMAPRERMGYAMGTLQMGLWSGTAAGPLIGGLIADNLGFRATFITTAVLIFAAGLLVTFGVRGIARPTRSAGAARPSMLAGWRAIFASAGVPAAYAARFLASLAQSMLLPFTPLFIQMLMPGAGHIGTFTGLVVGVSSATGTATALYLGRLGDRAGHRRVLMGSALAATICYIPQAFVVEPWQLLVLQALGGAAWGGMTPSISALLSRYTAPGSEGAVYGLDSSIVSAARAAAPLIGAGVVLGFGLRGIFIASAVVCLATLALAAARLPADEPATAPTISML
jgi:DHA1 family multidrug resistance protein-like MFS transporter